MSNPLVLATVVIAALILLVLLLGAASAVLLRARRGGEATRFDDCALVCVAISALLVTMVTLPIASLWDRVRGKPTPHAPWERRHS